MKKALITGITGQDGSYLAEFLLSKGYEVHGIIRRSSTFNTSRIDHIFTDPHEDESSLFLHYGDVSNGERVGTLINLISPDEIYHLAAQSHVMVSFDMPEYTSDVTGISSVRFLEYVRRQDPSVKFYQASSSEMFGSVSPPQDESTPFRPRSPHAAAKLLAYWNTVNYRDGYNLFACNGILFNHESNRRGETFVTRKVSRAVAGIVKGIQSKLYLGNLNSRRDWGYAPDYVEAMWLILQQNEPEDYVIGTGESHSIEEFVSEAFSYVGLNWKKYVELDERYLRPTEVDSLRASPQKAAKNLGWKPRIKFDEIVKIMVDAELESLGLSPVGEGKSIIESKYPDWHQWYGSVITKSKL